jgi:hypothetical protein
MKPMADENMVLKEVGVRFTSHRGNNPIKRAVQIYKPGPRWKDWTYVVDWGGS